MRSVREELEQALAVGGGHRLAEEEDPPFAPGLYLEHRKGSASVAARKPNGSFRGPAVINLGEYVSMEPAAAAHTLAENLRVLAKYLDRYGDEEQVWFTIRNA